jgi:hypothetical protein
VPRHLDQNDLTLALSLRFSGRRVVVVNAGRYVIGVADRTYTVTGEMPVMQTV